MADLRLMVVSGSLREASLNTLVAESLISHAPDAVAMHRFDLRPVPMFDQDVEEAGDPPPVVALKQAMLDADGLVVVTPEYNVGVPALTKNAIDWLSRPYGDGPIKGKAVGVVAVSPGGRAGIGARSHLMDTLSILTERAYPETLGVGKVYDKLVDGELGSDGVDELMAWFRGFLDFAGT